MSTVLALIMILTCGAATWHLSRKLHPALLIAMGVALKVIGSKSAHAFPVVIGTSGERLGSIVYQSLSNFMMLLQVLGLIVIIHSAVLLVRRFRRARQPTAGQG
jgi:cytochrome bd-type quinol oxidase subunit 2